MNIVFGVARQHLFSTHNGVCFSLPLLLLLLYAGVYTPLGYTHMMVLRILDMANNNIIYRMLYTNTRKAKSTLHT